MEIGDFHLSYCSNIHPGESWAETFANIQLYVPDIQKAMEAPAMGIGLRLSKQAADELLEDSQLSEFKAWLQENNCYVFTLNGFPYGKFHRGAVKDKVHQPDWSTSERLEYTRQLFEILAYLVPEGMDGGISTSPLSYKPWFKDKEEDLAMVYEKSTENLLKIVDYLMEIEEEGGPQLHLDIEPEPDGLIENSQELIEYFEQYLVPASQEFLAKSRGMSEKEAESTLKQYIQVCYDVCHFAVAYEEHAKALNQFDLAGISIGKFQISSALKINWQAEGYSSESIRRVLEEFVEDTYLHQVIERSLDGQQRQYPDLKQALEEADLSLAEEWRIHFHVPIFTKDYPPLSSTQSDIQALIKLLQMEAFSNHLEIETYTWEVLPQDLRLSLRDSIIREMQWFKACLLKED